jgi:hypothetical protein
MFLQDNQVVVVADPFDRIREQFGKDFDPNADYVLDRWDGDTPVYRRVMNDEEIYRAAMEAWVELIASLWDAVGKPIDEKRLDMYCRQLKIVPYHLLEKGIEYAVRNNTYNTVPAIGLIWLGIRNELNSLNLPPSTDIAEQIREWDNRMFKRAVYIFGA